jgi:hypothetical protein
VKKHLRAVASVNLILLYGFIVSLYCSTAFFQHPSFSEWQQPSPTQNYRSVTAKNSFTHTSPGQSLDIFSHAAGFSFKDQHNHFTVLLAVSGGVLLAKFLQQQFYSKHIRLWLRPYDIIFPFHYFW